MHPCLRRITAALLVGLTFILTPGVGAAAATERFVLPEQSAAGIGVHELSGLAWDADSARLYAVSDRGYLYRFRLQLKGGKIVACDLAGAAQLVAADGQAPQQGFNAEGLTIVHGANGVPDDAELVVSLESKPPQIMRFTAAGRALGAVPVPAPANDLAHYAKKKRGLEAVVMSSAYGVMTAPEAPLEDHPQDLHTLYAKDREWSFKRHAPDSRLKGVDLLANGNALVLERTRLGKKQLGASLREVDLSQCQPGQVCATRTLAVLPAGPDNFEGMTLLDPHQVLLASDNGGKAALQTVLVLVTLP